MVKPVRRPVAFAHAGIMPNIPSQFVIRRPPPAVFHGTKPYSLISHFDQFAQQQPMPCIDVGKQNNLNNANCQEWRNSITPDLRNHLTWKLTQAIYPTRSPEELLNKRFQNLVAYAKNVEREALEKTKSRWEYYQFLSKKIDAIQKELVKKRQERKINLEKAANKPNAEEANDRLVSKQNFIIFCFD